MSEAAQATGATVSVISGGKAAIATAIKYSMIYVFIAAAALFSFLSAIVVMSLTLPKKQGEWICALISTLVSSFSLGIYLAIKLNMLNPVFQAAESDNTLLACVLFVPVLGLIFASGLPAWMVVRGLFNYANKRKNDGIDVLVNDVRQAWR